LLERRDGSYNTKAIHDERAFDRMLIVAGTLEDAGCDNADILNHCREPRGRTQAQWLTGSVLTPMLTFLCPARGPTR
jgi:hypothetical protein